MLEEDVFQEAELNFRETVPAGQGIRITQSFHMAGKITQILFHFPPGNNGLVRVRLLKDEKPFYPIQGHLALDNATPVHYVEAEYYEKEPLTYEVLNGDSLNPHTPTCTVTIRYKRPWWQKRG